MSTLTHVVALMPARGGSKGLPGKNIKVLGGQPLIAHTVKAALGVQGLTGCYVSTDDRAIAHAAESAGATIPFMRPPELATDKATSQDVVKHFLHWYEEENGSYPKVLVLLQPTSPLRTAMQIQEALFLYSEKIAKGPCTVVSVTPAKPLSWHGNLTSQHAFMLHQSLDLHANRQQLLHSEGQNACLNGAIYISSTDRFLTDRVMQPTLYGYAMPSHTAVDIDTQEDFDLAEFYWMRTHQTTL